MKREKIMEKLNLVELLRDCPSGMELDCTMWDNLYFDRVENDLIHCYYELDGVRNTTMFLKNGCYTAHKLSKCVIFPKGKTTWKGFHRPFNAGDVVITTLDNIAIIKKPSVSGYSAYVCMPDKSLIPDLRVGVSRLATEEEKKELFDTIKAYGYRWNDEIKNLEKLPQKSKISWHTGTPKKLGYYIVTLSDGSVSSDIYLESTQHWDRYRLEKIVAWCPVEEIEPYND